MGSDCTVKIDDAFLNVRVGAIIMKDGKFLMAGNGKDDFLYSVGGRVKFGETSEEAVVREVFEETGIKMEVPKNLFGWIRIRKLSITPSFSEQSYIISLQALNT